MWKSYFLRTLKAIHVDVAAVAVCFLNRQVIVAWGLKIKREYNKRNENVRRNANEFDMRPTHLFSISEGNSNVKQIMVEVEYSPEYALSSVNLNRFQYNVFDASQHFFIQVVPRSFQCTKCPRCFPSELPAQNVTDRRARKDKQTNKQTKKQITNRKDRKRTEKQIGIT